MCPGWTHANAFVEKGFEPSTSSLRIRGARKTRTGGSLEQGMNLAQNSIPPPEPAQAQGFGNYAQWAAVIAALLFGIANLG
jgi:hypothetical protein